MPIRLKVTGRYLLECALALAPWLISMYVFFWLVEDGIWTAATPHRGKMSVALLATGMFLSFLVHSRLSERRRK